MGGARSKHSAIDGSSKGGAPTEEIYIVYNRGKVQLPPHQADHLLEFARCWYDYDTLSRNVNVKASELEYAATLRIALRNARRNEIIKKILLPPSPWVREWAAYVKEKFVLPTLRDPDMKQHVRASLTAGATSQYILAKTTPFLHAQLEGYLQSIQLKSLQTVRFYLNQSLNPQYSFVQHLVTSNAAWWLSQPWATQLYISPLLVRTSREEWAYVNLSEMCASGLYPGQVSVTAESLAWYALIGITATQARLSAKHAVMAALQESRQAAEKQKQQKQQKQQQQQGGQGERKGEKERERQRAGPAK